MNPTGLSPSRIGEASDQTAMASTTTTVLHAIHAQASPQWNGVRSASGVLRVARTRIPWRTFAKVTTPR